MFWRIFEGFNVGLAIGNLAVTYLIGIWPVENPERFAIMSIASIGLAIYAHLEENTGVPK